MRHFHSLNRRYRIVLAYTGIACSISGVTILSPLLALLVYPEELPFAPSFALAGLVLLVLGSILGKQLSQTESADLTMPEGAVVVVLSWLAAIGFAAVPFAVVGHLSVTQALFESTSGWTTTGLSVVDVTQSPHLILLLRSITQLVGGGRGLPSSR